MRVALQYLYTAYCLFWITFIYVFLFPFVFIFLQSEKTKPIAARLNYYWARIFFRLTFMPVSIEYEEKPNLDQAYVFVGNHFSYLDVPVMQYVIKNYFAFVGKSDVKSIPVLGYMFRKLHIQVDRSEKDSRTKALQRSLRAIKNGRSIAIFPEGGIFAKEFPTMHQPLQDGAFIMAIENKVPIIPVTLHTNYKIMPSLLLLSPMRLKVIVHKAVDTNNKTKEDIEAMKAEVLNIMQTALNFNH